MTSSSANHLAAEWCHEPELCCGQAASPCLASGSAALAALSHGKRLVGKSIICLPKQALCLTVALSQTERCTFSKCSKPSPTALPPPTQNVPFMEPPLQTSSAFCWEIGWSGTKLISRPCSVSVGFDNFLISRPFGCIHPWGVQCVASALGLSGWCAQCPGLIKGVAAGNLEIAYHNLFLLIGFPVGFFVLGAFEFFFQTSCSSNQKWKKHSILKVLTQSLHVSREAQK